MTNLLPVDFAKAIHNSSDRQRFTIKDRGYGDTVCEVFASLHSKYLLHRHPLPFSFEVEDISADSECYKPMKERGYKHCVYIPSWLDSRKLQKIFKGLIAFKPILYNLEDHHRELKQQLYQTMINMPDNTRFTLETGDGGYNSVIVRRKGLYTVLTSKLVPGAEIKPSSFDFEINKRQSNYDATDYKTSIGLSSYSDNIDKLLEGVVCIRLQNMAVTPNLTFKSGVTTTKESTDNMIEFNINHDVEEALEYTFKHLHALPHNATVILEDQNGFKYPGIIHKTNLVHAIFTQARCNIGDLDFHHYELKEKYGATGFIGIGVFYSNVFSRQLKYIDSIFIKEEDMNPKDISNGPILNNTISTGAKKMSKLVVKEIILKEISEAGLRRHMPSIVTDLGYELDKDTGNTMWPQNSEIDLTATPVNITPTSVKEIIVTKIKEEPAEDSKWMNIARKYNLIQSVILKEKDAKA